MANFLPTPTHWLTHMDSNKGYSFQALPLFLPKFRLVCFRYNNKCEQKDRMLVRNLLGYGSSDDLVDEVQGGQLQTAADLPCILHGVAAHPSFTRMSFLALPESDPQFKSTSAIFLGRRLRLVQFLLQVEEEGLDVHVMMEGGGTMGIFFLYERAQVVDEERVDLQDRSGGIDYHAQIVELPQLGLDFCEEIIQVLLERRR